MKIALSLLAVGGLALAVGCQSRWTAADFVGSARNQRTIESAQTVRMWRLALIPRSSHGADSGAAASDWDERPKWQSQYESIGGGAILDQAQASKLKGLLLAVTSYERGLHPKGTDFAGKLCGFFPIVRIRFEDGRRVAEAWLCFSCNDVRFTDEYQSFAQEDFRPMSRDLLALVKSVLQNDPEIIKIGQR